jgi:CubicO group peptidase (beta-lactamase class C family)
MCVVWIAGHAQLYFPPTGTDVWETTDPSSLGWCTDQLPPLLDLLEQNNTKAFLVLKDGRIVIEHYYGTFTQDSAWYWASAGKSLTAFLVGLAQQEGSLDIDDPTSDHLGLGWTALTPEQEQAITIRHQLTMTTGLDDGVSDLDCTDPACLQYLAEPGSRWSYHNAPYTLLDGVISAATGVSLNSFVFTRLTQPTGVNGLYLPVGYNNVFFSTPRSMARFGLLMQADGVWNGTTIMNDQAYFNDMISTSQPLNEAYGYLWWLNGTSTYMMPQTQFVFTGPALPDAPPDTYMALGKNGQILNLVPSLGLIIVRMGNIPGTPVFVPNVFNNDIWRGLNAVLCTNTAVSSTADTDSSLEIRFDPDHQQLHITSTSEQEIRIHDNSGRTIMTRRIGRGNNVLDVHSLAAGIHVIRRTSTSESFRFMNP